MGTGQDDPNTNFEIHEAGEVLESDHALVVLDVVTNFVTIAGGAKDNDCLIVPKEKESLVRTMNSICKVLVYG